MSSTKRHYGIISTATIVPRFIKALQANGDIVEAIASRSLEKAKALAKQLGIEKAYGSYEALYEDESIEVVYIATPNHTHYQEVMNALKHHKHVIVEKPFALSGKDAFEMFRFAKEQGCFLMEAQKSVFLPATIRLKELIEQKVLGECQQISMMSSFPGAYDKEHWMYKESGGVLYGSATYTIEYLMYLFHDPAVEIQAAVDTAESGAVIDAGIHLVLNGHLLADSHITMKVRTDNAAVFYFDKGYIRVENYWKARKLEIHPYDGAKYEESFPVEYEMVYEAAHVDECLDNQLLTSPIMSCERTILCTQMVEQLVKDAHTE